MFLVYLPFRQSCRYKSGCDLRDSKRLAGKELGQKGIRAALRMCGPQPVLWFPYWIHGPRCPRVPLAKFTLLGKNVSDLPLSTFSLNSSSHFHHFTGVLLWGTSSFVGDHTHSPWSQPSHKHGMLQAAKRAKNFIITTLKNAIHGI